MLLRIVEFRVRKGLEQKAREVFNEVAAKVASFPGCKYVALWQDMDDPSHFFTFSVWDSRDSLKQYLSSDVFRHNWQKLKALFSERARAISFHMLEEKGGALKICK